MELKSFTSPNDRNVAVQAGELDGTISDVMTEATFKQNGIDMTITSDILENFKILASPNSGITEMKGLADKNHPCTEFHFRIHHGPICTGK